MLFFIVILFIKLFEEQTNILYDVTDFVLNNVIVL